MRTSTTWKVSFTPTTHSPQWTDEGSALRKAIRDGEIKDLRIDKAANESSYMRSFYREYAIMLTDIESSMTEYQRNRYEKSQEWIKRGWDEMTAKMKEFEEQIKKLEEKPV